MAVILVVFDGPNNDIVDIVRREEASLEPFGGRLFGPSPRGNPFPRASDANELRQLIILQTIRENIDTSPYLTEAKREQLRGVYASILPGDRLQGVPRAAAEDVGLIERSPRVSDLPPSRPRPIIARFVDP